MSARRAWIALVAAAAYVPACFFELAAVVEETDSGLNGAGGGSGGMGAGGSDSGGGSGDASVDASCACPDLQNAAETCAADACAIASCDDGFGDCNGVVDDGCETDFAGWPSEPPSSDLLEVNRFEVDPIVDGIGAEWVGVGRQAVAVRCGECTTQEYPLEKPSGVLAQPEDFTAVFRVGWTSSFLYAFVEVRDDDFVDTPSLDRDGVLRPALQDAIELLLDGNNSGAVDGGSGGYDENDRQLFFGLNGSAEDPTEPVPPNATPRAFTVVQGRGCYTAEIALDWGYIKVGSTSLVIEGDQFGFDLAVNDWDRGSADAGAQFESQLFWKSPGDSYWIDNRGFGTIILGGTSITSPP